MTKRYINVAYKDREMAKRLGARWDASVKRWYCPADSALAKVYSWRKGSGVPSSGVSSSGVPSNLSGLSTASFESVNLSSGRVASASLTPTNLSATGFAPQTGVTSGRQLSLLG